MEIGRAAAKAVLDWRQNDGWPTTQAAATAPDPTYALPPFPGLWQPTPPANSFATFTFPQSWNAHDSLGEAYAAAGQNDLAIKNYEKSVELNPKNTAGLQALKKLRQH